MFHIVLDVVMDDSSTLIVLLLSLRRGSLCEELYT